MSDASLLLSLVRAVAFTMVRDEGFFLPLWLDYYSRFFPELVVLDHCTRDDSIERARDRFAFRHVRLDYECFLDMEWVTEVAKQMQRELLQDHDVVLYADADEIVWHETGLDRYIESLAHDIVATTGWQVIQLLDEPPLKPSRPILAQRQRWCRHASYDKPLLARVPVNWTCGFHHALQADGRCTDPSVVAQGHRSVPRDEQLLLIHLHYADFDRCREKNYRNAGYYLSGKAFHNGWGRQSWLTGEELEAYLREIAVGPSVAIPEVLRQHPPV